LKKRVDKSESLCYTVSEERQNSQIQTERGVKNARNDQNYDELCSRAVFDVPPNGRINKKPIAQKRTRSLAHKPQSRSLFPVRALFI
jgi:hypothetical protein